MADLYLRTYKRAGYWTVELWEGENATRRSSAYDVFKGAAVGVGTADEAFARGVEMLDAADASRGEAALLEQTAANAITLPPCAEPGSPICGNMLCIYCHCPF